MSGDILECHQWGDGSQQPGVLLSTLQSQDSQHNREGPAQNVGSAEAEKPDRATRLTTHAHALPSRRPPAENGQQPVSLDDGSSKMHPCFPRTDLKLGRGNFQKNKREDVLLNYMKPVTASLT